MGLKIILISGKARSGKDTMAKALQDYFHNQNQACEICHFADELKTIAKDVFGWNGKKDDKGRQLLIDLGESARGYDEDFWVNHLKAKLVNQDTIYIIPDCRYPNEIEAFKDYSPIIYRIEREYQLFRNGLTIAQCLSKSETALDSYKFPNVIKNCFDSAEKFEKFVKESIAPEVFK